MDDVIDVESRLVAYGEFFESLTPETLDRLSDWFTLDARFKDPFNDVTGISAIKVIFEHMYQTLENPQFKIIHCALAGSEGYLHWQFHFYRGDKQHLIDGLSKVTFNQQGLIVSHVDYWDAAEQVYEKIPIVSALLRFIRARISSS